MILGGFYVSTLHCFRKSFCDEKTTMHCKIEPMLPTARPTRCGCYKLAVRLLPVPRAIILVVFTPSHEVMLLPEGINFVSANNSEPCLVSTPIDGDQPSFSTAERSVVRKRSILPVTFAMPVFPLRTHILSIAEAAAHTSCELLVSRVSSGAVRYPMHSWRAESRLSLAG